MPHEKDRVSGVSPAPLDQVQKYTGPGPKIHWTRSNNSPWTWSTIYSLHTNRSHYRWTWSNTQNRTTAKNTLDQVQQHICARFNTHLGPGPIHIWTRSNNNPWTRSTIYSLHANGSHYRWTWSNTQNRTTTKNTLDQVQQHLGPGPIHIWTRSNNNPWTRSKGSKN